MLIVNKQKFIKILRYKILIIVITNKWGLKNIWHKTLKQKKQHNKLTHTLDQIQKSGDQVQKN